MNRNKLLDIQDELFESLEEFKMYFELTAKKVWLYSYLYAGVMILDIDKELNEEWDQI